MRSLLAFWAGGASAVTPTEQAGARSLLAPWIGGAAAPPAAEEQVGVRSLLAPWMGGAGSAQVVEQYGARGLLAFWIGGAAAGPDVTPPEPVPLPPSGGGIRLPRRLIDAQRAGLIEADEILLLIAGSVAAGLLH